MKSRKKVLSIGVSKIVEVTDLDDRIRIQVDRCVYTIHKSQRLFHQLVSACESVLGYWEPKNIAQDVDWCHLVQSILNYYLGDEE